MAQLLNIIDTMRVESNYGSTVRIPLQAPESTDVANVRSGLFLVPSQVLPARDNPLEPMAITVFDAYPTHGGHSDVYKVKMVRNGVVLTAALKVLRPFSKTPEDLQLLFNRELTIWKKLEHKNIAPLYAYTQWRRCPAMAVPWYQHGTASDYLRRPRNANYFTTIMGVADGLAYMHDKGIVHGDVKGMNIMIDNERQARLIDFGSSHFLDDFDAVKDLEGFSLRWCAPELLKPRAISTPSSDVYAFANTMLELLTGHSPYQSVPEMVVFNKVMNGTTPWELTGDLFLLLLGQSKNILRALRLWVLLKSCWVEEPSLRHSMREIQRALRRIYA